MKERALITGLSGQDGSYLAEVLLGKGYEVHGLIRRIALENPQPRLDRIRAILPQITLHPGTLESYASIYRVVEDIAPDECYHLGAQSYVSESFNDEFSTMNTNINGTHYILSAIKEIVPNCKFYFAGSSEMYGNSVITPQTEFTPFNPRSPYGISKVTGFHLTKYYRERYNMFACNGIAFNHESPRRGLEFVTRKISNTVAKIKLGLAKELRVGNIEAKRDWGFAGDYVEGMWAMLQQDKPEDYVLATNKTHSVKEFIERAFGYVGLDWREYIVIDKSFYRPNEVNILQGDYAKAKIKLNWQPTIGFEGLVDLMVSEDLRRLKQC